MSLWLDNSSNSNNIKQSYVHGFLDISGGNVNIRANNNLNIFSETDTTTSRFTLSSDEIRVYDDNTSSFVDLSNNKLQYIKDVNENVQTRLTDLTSRTQKIRTTTGGEIEVSANIIPNVASAIDLGSETKPFKSLYLNDSTLYFVGSGDNATAASFSIDDEGEVYVNKGSDKERKLTNQSKKDNNKTKIGHDMTPASDGITLDMSGIALFRNDVRINGHLNVDGSINFLGEFIQKDTVITVTEQMDLSNDGTGPALIVRQHGSQAIASFYDDGDVAMIINDGGDVSMNMNLNVGGNAEIDGSTTITGITALNSTLTVSKTATLNSNAIVSGDVSMNSNLNVGGNAEIDGSTTITGAMELNSTLTVSNTATLNSNAIVSGDVSMNSKLSVGDDVSFNNDVDVAGDLKVSGNISGTFADNSIPSSAISGGASSINVSVINTDGDISNQLTASTLRFDTDSGFALDDLSNGVVKVKMNSTFKYWNVEGQDTLIAEGLDTMDFFTDGNIQIVTDGSDANHITFKAPNMVDSSANQDISGIKTFQQIFVYDDVCLNSNLNVIGNADINGTLDVAGDITGVTDLNVTGYSYLDDVETTGNVGIKTSEAAVYELEVNGTAYATDISAGNSIKVGQSTITTSTIPNIDSSINTMESKLNGIATNANNYILPTASANDLGGVKVGADSNISINNGVIAIPQEIETTSSVQFDSLVLSGNLTVNGTTTTLDTENLDVSDSLIGLSKGLTGSPANDAGILINRGTSDNVFMGWDESADKFTMGTTTETSSSTGDLSITKGTLVADLEGNVSGNASTVTNGVYTTSSVTALSDVSSAGSGAIITSTERSKLDGIESGADVTDATNVSAAGAVMTSGNQTIGGTKTFTSMTHIGSAPTTNQTSTNNAVGNQKLFVGYSGDAQSGILMGSITGNTPYISSTIRGDGTNTTSKLRIYNANTIAIETLDGDVGIGKFNPAYKLDVNGTAYATDISAGSSIKVGYTTISSTGTDLSGTPTAPTASSDTNNTQIATTAFVQTAISSNSSSSSGSSYVTEQPPVLASISKDAQSSYVDVTWVKFDEVYKDAFTGRSYPIYLQTFVDISFTSINNQSSNGWKTIRIGNGNYNTSGTETTPLTTLRFTAANGLNYNNSTSYTLSFSGKPGIDNLPIFTQDDTFDLRVYAVNNSGTVPAYIYIYNVGLKTTGAPSAVLIKNTDTYTKTSFKMDVSFNLDSEDTSITSGIDITEYDISYTLIDTKSNETMTHSGVFDLNNYNSKDNLTFTGLKPGSKYRVQIRAKNALNSEIGPYGDAFTGSNFTNDGTNRYINTSDLNSVSHDGMTISRGNARGINGKIVGNNSRDVRFVFSANFNNSKINFGNTSSFYVNYGRQGKDFTNGTYVTATFEILKNDSVQYSDTMNFTNSASALTASIGATGNQFTFTSASSYTDKGKTANYSKGFVYSSSLSCTGNANTNSVFNANFPASTDKYKVQYTISSQAHNNNQRIDDANDNNTSASKNSADFYVDDYSGTPDISYTTLPTVNILGKTYLFGIPSITNIQLKATYDISNFASYYIPYGTITGTNNIHSKSEVTSSKYGYSFDAVVTRGDIYTTATYSTEFTENNSSITNGTYNDNTTQSLLVTVYYLNNSGRPQTATKTSTTDSNNLGATFKDTTTSYSGSNLRFFNGSDTISGSNIDTDSTTFATTYSSHISSALLYFNGKFVAGGYSQTYSGTSLSPFSNWSSGFAVTGPNYSSYSNTGSGGFKWIAIKVSRSGNNVDLSNFKIKTEGTDPATRHDNHLSDFGSKYKAYIYQDGKFGSLSSASNSGATSWFGTGPTSISAANSANGALQADGYNAFVNSNGGTTLYLIVGIKQNSNYYFTF